jgi:hypothetical protein
VTECCAYGNELSFSIKGGENFEHLSNSRTNQFREISECAAFGISVC